MVMGHYEEDFVQPFGYRHHHLILVIVLALIFNMFLFIFCKRRCQKSDE